MTLANLPKVIKEVRDETSTKQNIYHKCSKLNLQCRRGRVHEFWKINFTQYNARRPASAYSPIFSV